MWKKIDKYFAGYLILSFSLFAFIFKDLIFNISTNLIDWRDYAYVVWVINHFIELIKEGSWTNTFNGNSFYPLQGTLLFSDTLWPQTVITYFFSLFANNLVTQFNLTFLSTLILNTLAIYFFWAKVFKEKNNVFFASLLTNFSPFFFLQLSHFQMISYWPFFFALGYLLKQTKKGKDSLLIGVFLALQFYAAVYWAIFLLTVIGLYYLVQLGKKGDLKRLVRELAIIGALFAILVGPILFKYIQVKKAYNITRDYSEYVNYSAHLSDYFFSGNYGSFLSGTKLFTKINSLNKHYSGELAGSASLVVYFLALIGIFYVKKKNKLLSFSISITTIDTFFLLLTLTGLIFSLGPRLSFNGSYLAIPLPFAVALKFLIIFEPIRATARFSALLYLGLFYFATKGLAKINRNNSLLLMMFALILFGAEIIPKKLSSEPNNYYAEPHQLIEADCAQGAVLLEYPFNENRVGANVATNLKYKASQLVASVKHDCNLVNGYAGFDPQEYNYYIDAFESALTSTDSARLRSVIGLKQIDFIKINKTYLSTDNLMKLENIELKNNFGEILFENDEYILLDIDEKLPTDE